jgi:hypothetical protein
VYISFISPFSWLVLLFHPNSFPVLVPFSKHPATFFWPILLVDFAVTVGTLKSTNRGHHRRLVGGGGGGLHRWVVLVGRYKPAFRCFMTMNHTRSVCLYVLCRHHQRKSRKFRKFWVYPLLTQSNQVGAFQTVWGIKERWKKTLECRCQYLNNYCNICITFFFWQDKKMRTSILPSEVLIVTFGWVLNSSFL